MIHVHKKYFLYSNDLDDVKKVKKITSILPYLKEKIEFIDGVTLMDLFELFKTYEDEINNLFFSEAADLSFSLFYDEMKENKFTDRNINFINFSWIAEKGNFSDTPEEMKVDDDLMSIWSDVTAITNNDREISITFIPMYDLKNARIKTDDDFNVVEYKDDIAKIVFRGKKEITVFELFDSLTREISIFGSPKRRNFIYNAMKKM